MPTDTIIMEVSLKAYQMLESNISNCYSYSGQKSTNNGRESFINYNYSKTVELSEIYSFVFNNWDTDTWNLSLTESPTLK